MTKVTLVSGFLGAGKTTFIRKLLEEVFSGEKIVLIENEYGEIGIDSGFLQDAGVTITEMNSGCICCTLVGDFTEALKKVIDEYAPDRIIIEPSGVGKLSDIIQAVEKVKELSPLEITERLCVVDAKKARIYLKNFGEFFRDQVQYASTLILSRSQLAEQEKLEEAVALLRDINAEATMITTPWTQLNAQSIRHAFEHSDPEGFLKPEAGEECGCHHHHEDECECHHHHHHHEECDDPECECHHHHHEEGECHHHHEECDDPECECHHHHHEECDDPDCECHHHHEHEHGHEHHHHEHHQEHEHEHEHHHHHHHHGHDADEVFQSWGRESAKSFSREGIREILEQLSREENDYGVILRAKGIVPLQEGGWCQFDMVPGEIQLRDSQADYTGRFCVIGCELKEEALAGLFGL